MAGDGGDAVEGRVGCDVSGPDTGLGPADRAPSPGIPAPPVHVCYRRRPVATHMQVPAMSARDVDAFLDYLTEDAIFRRQVSDALEGREDTGTATVELGRAAGFEFTVDELDGALEARYANRELSDAELDQVAAAGVTVGAGLGGVVHRTASGISIAFPDVCKTPSPGGGPVPVPYPGVGGGSDDGASKTTKGG